MIDSLKLFNYSTYSTSWSILHYWTIQLFKYSNNSIIEELKFFNYYWTIELFNYSIIQLLKYINTELLNYSNIECLKIVQVLNYGIVEICEVFNCWSIEVFSWG